MESSVILSALPVLKKVPFNTGELFCPGMSLIALKPGTPAIEMPARQVNLFFHFLISLIRVPARISTHPITVFKLRVSTVPFEFGIIIAKNAPNTGSAVNINAV